MYFSRLFPFFLLLLFVAMLISSAPLLAEKSTTFAELETLIKIIDQKYCDNISQDRLLRAFIDGVNSELEELKIFIKPLRYFTLSSDMAQDIQSLKNIFDTALTSSSNPSKEELIQRGIGAMISSLNDEGNKFYLPGAYHVKLVEPDFKGGIGMYVDEEKDRDGNFVIVDTLEGYPSNNAGLRSGDRILRVDGHEVGNLEIHQLAELVIGQIGSKVTVTALREGAPEQIEAGMERVSLSPNPKTLIYRPLEDKIGYMKFKFLGYRMEEETWKTLSQLASEKITGLVIDLRNNAGFPQAAISLSGLFLPAQTPIATEIRKISRQVFVAKNANHFKLPIVILLNEYSSSASSIMAGALRMSKRATIVGTASRWRYNGQEKFTLEDGSVLTLRTHYYELADGKVLKGRGEGIKPDVEVPQDPFLTDPASDAQLQKAIEILKK